MNQYLKIIYLVTCLSLPVSAANVLISQDSDRVTQAFLDESFELLPPKIQERLLARKKTIPVKFQVLPAFRGEFQGKDISVGKLSDTEVVRAPDCRLNVDNFIAAKVAQEVNNVAIEYIKSASFIRHNGQVYGYLSKKEELILHSGFKGILAKGPTNEAEFNCDHKSFYKLAQGTVINLLVRLYNAIAQDHQISSRPQYYTKAGWEYKGVSRTSRGAAVEEVKKMQGYWPRAITPYEYAGSVAAHLGLNMEYFLLDSEYACRRPLLNDYLSTAFQDKNGAFDPLKSERTCEVNYELKIPQKDYLSKNAEYFKNNPLEALETFSLDPKRVFNIHYLRAGAGGGAGSFGHSMYRYVVCRPGAPLNSDCEKERNYDLVVNPRANPLELRLNAMRALFGKNPYPSMFLVTPLAEIKSEYAVTELRHLYNIPFVGKKYVDDKGVEVNVMPDDDKRRMLWATLDQYWTYYGMYWFISNNCADETLRLYKMATEDERVLTLGKGITKPQDVNIKLHELGLMDEQTTKGLEPVVTIRGKIWAFITRKDTKWSDFEAQYAQNRQAYLDNTKTEISRYYDILSATRQIALLEGAQPKAVSSLKKVAKLAKKYVELAEPPAQADSKGKIQDLSEKEISRIVAEIRNLKLRYDTLMARQATPEGKAQLAQQFFRLVINIRNKRLDQVSSNAIRLAYSIVDAKEETLEKLSLTAEDQEKVAQAVENFSKLQVAGMPFRAASVKPGYGIPLKSEVVRGAEFINLLLQENEQMNTIIEVLAEVLAPDQAIDRELRSLLNHIRPSIPNRIKSED